MASDRDVWIANAADFIARTQSWHYVPLMYRVLNNPQPDDSFRDHMIWERVRDTPNTSGSRSARADTVVSSLNRTIDRIGSQKWPDFIHREALKFVIDEGSRSDPALTAIKRERETGMMFSFYSDNLLKHLGSSYDRGMSDPEFKETFEVVFPAFQAPIGAPLAEILANNPAFAQNHMLAGLLTNQESIDAAVMDLKTKVEQGIIHQVDGIESLRKEIRAGLAAQETSMNQIGTQGAQVLTLLTQQAESQRRSSIAQAEAKALRSGVFVLAALWPDKEQGRVAGIAMNAILDVRDTLREFETNMSLLSSASAVGSVMSAAILTGGLLGIGLALSSAFSEEGPSADVVILEQLQKLSEQIAKFQDDVRERFDRVDRSLNAIYQEMSAGFAEIVSRLATLEAGVSDIQSGLTNLVRRLDQVEGRIVGYLEEVLDQEFYHALEDYLGYLGRTGQALPAADYDDAVVAILNFLNDAASPARSGQWTPGSMPSDVASALRGRDWAASVNWFRGLAAERTGRPLSGARANPVRWRIASRAYITLAQQNVATFQGLPLTTLDRLLDEGVSFAREFGSTGEAIDSQSIAALMKSLLDEHAAAARRVTAVAHARRAALLTASGAKLVDLNPAGGVLEQAVPGYLDGRPVPAASSSEITKEFRRGETLYPLPTHPIIPPSVMMSEQDWPDLAVSPRIWGSLPRVWREAEALGLGSVSLMYGMTYTDAEFWQMPPFWFVYGRPQLRYYIYLTRPDNSDTRIGVGVSELGTKHRIWTSVNAGSANITAGLHIAFPMRDHLAGQFPWSFPDPEYWDDGTSISEYCTSRRTDLLIGLQNDIISGLAETGDLSLAIDNLGAIVDVIRGCVSLMFPNSLKYDDTLRGLLFGIQEQPERSPLLSREMIDHLVGVAAVGGVVDVARITAGSLLIDLDQRAEVASASLARALAEALSAQDAAIDLAMVAEIEQLRVLRAAHAATEEPTS